MQAPPFVFQHLTLLSTHFPLDRMATISQFVPKGPTDNKPSYVQVMAWYWTGDQPLPELMITQFTDAYTQHWGEMS